MESARRDQVSAGGAASADVLADIEDTVRTLEATLRSARGSVTDAEHAIGLLRTEIVDVPSDTSVPRHTDRAEDHTDPRPLGWLFRSDRS